MIVGFLLSFGNEEEVFWIFVMIIDRILPKNFYKKSCNGSVMSGFLAEQEIILEICKENFMN